MYYLQFMFLFNFQLPIPNSCFQFTNSIFMIGIFFLKVFRKQCKNSKMHKVHASIMTIHCVVIIAPLNKYYFVMIVKQQKNRPKIKPVFQISIWYVLQMNLLSCQNSSFQEGNKPTPKFMFRSSQISYSVFGHLTMKLPKYGNIM